MSYKFDVYDYLILFLVLTISLGIGFYHAIDAKYGNRIRNYISRKRGKRQKNKNDFNMINEYLIASSSMSAIPISFSLLASFYSATTLLGVPSEVYHYGVEFIVNLLSGLFGPVVGALLTGPMFARLRVTSVFEYFKLRYKTDYVRQMATTLYIIRSFITTAIFIFGPATTITALTALNVQSSIFLIGSVATLYTTIGGIKTVIWSDVFQLIVMFGGVIVILTKGIVDAGGLERVLKINYESGRLNLFDFTLNPFARQSFWILIVGSFFYMLGPYALDQTMLQRFSAAKNKRHAKIAILFNIPMIICLVGLLALCGLVLFANYANCDPLSAPHITNVRNPNQLMVYLVTDKMGLIKGFTGLFVSSIIAGALSSVSSILNSMSAILWEDCLKKMVYFRKMNDKQATLTIKTVVIVCGALSTALSIMVSTIGGNLLQINTSLNGALGSPLTGVFLLSSLCPFSNTYGAITGMIGGMTMGFWLTYGAVVVKPVYPKFSVKSGCYSNNTQSFISNSTFTATTIPRLEKVAVNLEGFNRIYSLSFGLYTVIGILTTVIIGIIVSLATGGYKDKFNQDLILFKCLRKKKDDSNEGYEKIRLKMGTVAL